MDGLQTPLLCTVHSGQGPSSTDLDQPQGLPPRLRPLFKWRRFSGFATGRPNEFRDETLWWFGDLHSSPACPRNGT